jgi:parvulin-like peptidyl-prolyl isomerase
LAKKKNIKKPPRQITKRQLSSIKRQKRRQNFIFYGGILVIAVVLVIVFVGLYIGEIRPYHQTVVKVYDREYSAQYLMDAVKAYAIKTYGDYYTDELLLQDISYFVSQASSYIVYAELVRHAAEDLEITVSDDEVKNDLEENEIKVNDASVDIARLSFLEEKLLEEHFIPQIPASAKQVNMMAMFLESETQVNEIKSELVTSDNFTGLAEEYSLESYTSSEKGDLGWNTREYLEYELGTSVPVEYAFDAEIGTLSQPIYDENLTKSIGYWLVNVLERDDENNQAHVQVILSGSEEEANRILQRFINGEDFGELVTEFSLDDDSREQGGDLGWVTSGSRSTAFDAYVFNPETENVNIIGPFPDTSVSTTGGYWLVKVVDREEDRPLDEEERESLAEQDYNDWVAQLWEDATDEIDQDGLTLEVQEWIIEKITEKYS